MSEVEGILYRRTKYFLSPQLDLYKNIAGTLLASGDTVLDYGCCTGVGTLQLCSSEQTEPPLGVDVDQAAVNFARECFGRNARFHWADLLATPIPGTFDLITCIEVLEHCSEPRALIEKLVKLLKPYGRLVCSTVNREASYRKNNEHVAEWSPKEFLDMFPRRTELRDFQLQPMPLDSNKTPMVTVYRI